MKSKFSSFSIAVVVLVLAATSVQAQYPEDALRLGLSGNGVGSRSLGMGNAYTGVANDFSAIYWNPAGLAQMEYSEFSFGLSHLINKDNSTFLNARESYTTTATDLNALGLAYRVPTQRGSLVLAFGYNRQDNFTSGMLSSAFSPRSSIIQQYATDSSYYPSDLSDNIAYQLYLANLDTVNGKFISPITGNVTQIIETIESGGLNNWSIAAGLDVARNLSIGVTLTYLSGTYKYDRTYSEVDRARLWQASPFDFDSLAVQEFIEGDISGTNAKFGLMYRVPDRFRLGFSVKTPTSFTVKENFGSSWESAFDNGDVFQYPADDPNGTHESGQYDVVTPWEFSGGVSVIVRDMTLSADLEYVDWTQLEFENATSDVMALNKDMRTLFRGAANYRAGGEYDIAALGVRLRGGYMYFTSPYRDDPKTFDKKYFTAGLGFLLGPSTMLDIAYAHGWWETYRTNFGTSRSYEEITTDSFRATMSFRF